MKAYAAIVAAPSFCVGIECNADEITGIDFPVRRDKFTAGVEIPLAALGGAALLTVAAVVLRPRGRSGHANPS